MTTWAEALTIFAKTLPGFQPRINQNHLANRIEDALESGFHLFAQAGCGTGKSFAGTIPAIKKSKETGLPTIIATATKALQDQLANKDLPFLAKVVGGFTYAILKGRGNYVCLAKVDEMENKNLQDEILAATEEEDFNGEIDGLSLTLTPQEKASLSTSSDECPGKNECPFGKVCFAEKAKKKAAESNIVVANHAVLAADLAIKANQREVGIPEERVAAILPRYGAVVVDEAHELVDFVTSALGGQITAGSFTRLGSEISNFLGDRSASKELQSYADEVFGIVSRLLAGRDNKRDKNLLVTNSELASLAPILTDLSDALGALEVKVDGFDTYGNDKGLQKKKRLVKRLSSIRAKVQGIVLLDEEELVRWLEIGDGKKGDSINWAPLTVADFLRDELLGRTPVVFMSATLAVGTDFSPLANQLGADEYKTFDAGTPFDFQTQARTFIPNIPVPAGVTLNSWRASSIATMKELVRASNGRALLLFTSKVELEEAYNAIQPMINKMGHRALKQGDLSNRELAKIFAEDEHSVLFALKSFFTGVDKMPFPVPSDVIFKARTDALDRKYGPWQGFNRLTVPTMALSLMQAYGRLIRTVSDRGVVAILDSRLHGKQAKPYGGKIMKALPDAPVITDLAEAISYLESLEG
jgi:ATP-dependent DNA helicase DinG